MGRKRKPQPALVPLGDEARIYFRDQLRTARANALRDAEGFQEILFAVERLGSALIGKVDTLGGYKYAINTKAQDSPLAEKLPLVWSEWLLPVYKLYESVRIARNDALHQGAFARHLTIHAVDLAIILEDALMKDLTTVDCYMVRDPVCAFPWQPVGFVRQVMLENSFSYLPFYDARAEPPTWCLISDYAIAQYLRLSHDRNERLAKTLQEALDSKLL